MHEFLDSNPGLRSRFARELTFQDYSTDELVAITERFAGENEYRLTESAVEALRRIFERAPARRGLRQRALRAHDLRAGAEPPGAAACLGARTRRRRRADEPRRRRLRGGRAGAGRAHERAPAPASLAAGLLAHPIRMMRQIAAACERPRHGYRRTDPNGRENRQDAGAGALAELASGRSRTPTSGTGSAAPRVATAARPEARPGRRGLVAAGLVAQRVRRRPVGASAA